MAVALVVLSGKGHGLIGAKDWERGGSRQYKEKSDRVMESFERIEMGR